MDEVTRRVVIVKEDSKDLNVSTAAAAAGANHRKVIDTSISTRHVTLNPIK